MASVVQANATLGLSKGHHRVVFRNPRGRKHFYAFYVDSTGSFDRVVYEYSSDGINWSNASLSVVAVSNRYYTSFDVKIMDSGTDLDIWFVAHGQSITTYRRGNIADGNVPISWESGQHIDVAIDKQLAGPHCIAIARNDNGRLVVAFTEDFTTMGKDYRLTKLIGSDGDGASPNWSGETVWDDPSVNSNNQDKDEVWFGLENFSSSYPDRVLIVGRFPWFTDISTYRVLSAVPDWNGIAFSNTAMGYVSGSAKAISGMAVSPLIDNNDKAHALYVRHADFFVSRRAASAGDDDWETGKTLKTNTVDVCTLTLDTGPTPDELYAFYHDAADSQDFHYKKTPVDTISWGDEQTITFASDMIALTSWNRQIENGLHIGLEDADTDVWYHEVDVSNGEPPPEGQPTMIRTQGVPTGSGSRDRVGRWN